MKVRKKFAENCIPVKFRRRNAIVAFAPLFAVAALLPLLPTSLKHNAREAFKHVQIPVCAATIRWEKFVNALKIKTIPKADLVPLCENLLRENELLRLQLATSTGKNYERNGGKEMREIGNFILIPARVIRRDLATWASELLIDGGSRDGIYPAMGVISQNRVIGRIKTVNHRTAVVELLTSPQFRMVVHAAEDPEMAPIVFTGGERNTLGKSRGRVANVPSDIAQSNEKITLVTSELSGIFPGNIAVGTIDSSRVAEKNCSMDVILDGEALSKVYEVAVLANVGD